MPSESRIARSARPITVESMYAFVSKVRKEFVYSLSFMFSVVFAVYTKMYGNLMV